MDRPGNTNIAVASMVTAYARLMLYNAMEKIESESPGRVLYFDTDSIIFKHDTSKDWSLPNIANFLGEMTDEIADEYGSQAKMYRFASCGPKNYAYCVRLPDGTDKVIYMNIYKL